MGQNKEIEEKYSEFEQVKGTMANATFLHNPSQDAEIALVTDCSNLAMGGMLQEVSPDGLKPLGFFFR